MRGAVQMASQEFDDNAPMTLKRAAEELLRGVVKASTLRAAADRGDLAIEKLGRVHVVTPRAVREWRERHCCIPARKRAAAPTDGREHGSSETKRHASELDVLLRTAEGLTRRSAAQAALLQIAAGKKRS
jgi:hypothetical protein